MPSKIICNEKKHPGGKLVKVCVNILDNEVHGVVLTGDFFAEPEEVMEEVIKNLLTLKCNLRELEEKVIEIIERANVKIIGIDKEDIKGALTGILSTLATSSSTENEK
ncbi:MAG: hypothetical protein QXV54_03695 [Desulfurococcaceae archaeon]